MARELLQLINQARVNPLAVVASLGLDPDQVLADLPELYGILTDGLPPLGINEDLQGAARAHTQDMLDNNFYSHDSLDGRSYEDRMLDSGYDPVVAGETLEAIALLNAMHPSEAVSGIFENMFRDELDPSMTEKRNILDPDLREVGIGFGTGVLDLDGSRSNVVVTCDFGSSTAEYQPYIGGVVYRDLNQDGLYNAGEGVPGMRIIVYGGGLHLKTDEAGGFGAVVDPGGYLVILFSQTEELEIREVRPIEENKWVCFKVD